MCAKFLKFAFIFSMFFIGSNSVGQLTWQQLNTNTNESLFDSYFVDANKGFAVGANGTIIRTIDGGLSWAELGVGNSVNFFATHFVNSDKGWITGTNGTLLKTINGGDTWSITTLPPTSTFYDIHFVDEMTGWVAGATSTNTSVIYKTIDGGATWNPIGNTLSSGVRSIDFLNATYGMAVTYFDAYITIDGGVTWVPMVLPTTSELTRVELFSSSTAWIIGVGGLILKTTDGGSLWTPQSSPATSVLFDLGTVDGANLFAVGYDYNFITSNNGGTNWILNSSLTAEDSMFSVFSVNPSTHYITAASGVMYKSLGSFDLSFENYLSPTTLCPNQIYPLSIQLKSHGPYAATEATITVLKDGAPYLTYSWLGNMAPGTTEIINLGFVSIDSDALLSVVITGDDNTTNNSLIQPLSTYAVVDTGTNDLIVTCIGESIQLKAFGGLSYTWYNASADSTNQNQNIVATSNAIYYVDIKQSQCTIFDSVVVVLQDGCNTNAFSPNNDAVNDYFIIDGLIGPSKVTIYNRWGDEIIILENYDNVNIAWDGRDSNGKNVLEGTYFYAVDSDNPKSGWIQVIR